MFGPPEAGAPTGGPCLYEPAAGALFPNNWLRPRFYWTASGQNLLFELRLHSAAESNDLVVYTAQTKWTMPKTIWQSLAANVQGAPITVTIRQISGTGGTPEFGSGSSFTIAPAPAQGGMVFWSTASFLASAASTNLQGFQVGDESTNIVLTPPQVQQPVWAGPGDGGNFPQPPALEPVQCIGCHAATPDGNYVGFTVQWPWPNALASVSADSGAPVGAAPPWLSAGAIANLGPNTNDANYLGGNSGSAANNVDDVMLGIQTFSKAHYAAGDHVEIASLGASLDQPEFPGSTNYEAIQTSGVVSQLVWINLEWDGLGDAGGRPSAAPGATNNGGWGILARTGDAQSAGSPNWSHDGKTIAYTSVTNGTRDGRLGAGGEFGASYGGFTWPSVMGGTVGQADVKTIPYNANNGAPGGTGGAATSVMGASDPTYNEYFPSFSPDDTLLAFNRTPSTVDMYEQPAAEVFVVPAAGGTATRLAANDPAKCSGVASPGVENTWPKWAPAPAGGMVTPASDGKLYYWVTFSSIRINDPNNPATGSATGATLGKTQLYVAGVVVDPSQGNAITTFPAIYLWNQDPTENNLIPAWDNFTIPQATGVGMPPR
jgi:hypothetical protein